MKEELDKQLCEKFPKLFKDRYGNMQETAMCWGFEHGDGWFNIIWALCSNVQWHIDQSAEQHTRIVKYNEMRESMLAGDFTAFEEEYSFSSDPAYKERRRTEIMSQPSRKVPEIVPQVTVTQVKEKFGDLRFYYNGGDDEISGMVRMAESMSGCTCEECGNPGKRRGGGWIRTLCDIHAPAEEVYDEEPEEK